ncbi:hypothetical protein KC343_g14351 [Hortaea werneckii]|uniref:BTB domain-containing protein n=1 Tax=Hortaea werneckii TaxID=91943 RepID=A0A3M7E2N9_HORWE|nr:hypothetical protein KC352_g29054 [Hortaea werneckii]KAI7549284.1 hypothetical protein KC317_g14612 [Hortaea werneckii]KAI7597986.1 hypothetical protein KC346_g14439 [Hortaea werneckii]KAI7603831.1 hypothetical protein KC343_g14351 [Hortaea werneckii]KAI7639253.1 hypothetical protein KC319_g14492 [Hortaea werneckii]
MADTKAEEPERRDVDIAADGDVILALPQNLYLRVSSNALTLVSPVFKAMLGPRFREGKEPRSSDCPIEIPLPEDDGVAMKHLCLLLHGRTGDSYCHGDRTFPTQLEALAVLADKYDCVEAIALQAEAMLSRFWMYRATDHLRIQQLACLISASALLGLAPYFYVFTKSLVLDYCTPYSEESTGLPLLYLFPLEQQRSTARLQVHEAMLRVDPEVASCSLCSNRDVPLQNVPALSHCLSQNLGPTTWPPDFSTNSLQNILSEFLWPGDVIFETKSSCGHDVNATVKSRALSSKADEIYDALGLCLLCVKNGGKWTKCCNHEEDKVLAGTLTDRHLGKVLSPGSR